jgi:GxxExxY protein
MTELLYKSEVFDIIGAAMDVHTELGPGFLEAVYQEALEIELASRAIPFAAKKPLRIWYKNQLLEKFYEPDFVCYETIIVEIKALDKLTSLEESILLNYLKTSRLRVGVLINFGSHGKLEWKRFIH